MSRDLMLTALRDARPRNQPGFEESLARYDALRRRITTTPVPEDRKVARRVSRRLLGLSAAAAVAASLAAVAVVLTVSASSPASALAAARRALAATFAAPSGTMTVTVTQRGTPATLETTRWHGSDVAVSARRGSLGPDRQLLLIGGGVYVQRADGRWLHYADANKVGELGVAVQLARANVAGNRAKHVLALTTNIKRAAHADGSTVYTGTIPTSNPVRIANNPADDAILRLVNSVRGNGNPPVSPNPYDRHPAYYHAVQLKMTVARDGLVSSISLTVQPTSDSGQQLPRSTFGVTYGQLGATPPITPPAASTPAPPVIMTPRPVCPPPPHGPCGG